MTTTLSELQKLCAAASKNNGWYDRPIEIPEMIALLHSEVSEALESWRNGETMLWYRENGKPEGIAAEFADILIRLGDYAERLGIDLTQAVAEKMAYNATRGYRHGNKVG